MVNNLSKIAKTNIASFNNWNCWTKGGTKLKPVGLVYIGIKK